VGIQLPGELVSVLAMLGYNWPLADETKLYEMGQAWSGFPARVTGTIQQADATAGQVWAANQDAAITKFQQAWQSPESAHNNLRDGATAASLIGTGLTVCAGVVLALKINVIVQLTLLAIEIATAIAEAAVTFGASLLEIPIWKEITSNLIGELINQAITLVLGG
jgi:hypothetical protein